jgi:LCP family protein required for cell wall assembly
MSFTIRPVREEKKPSALRRQIAFLLPLLRSGIQYYKHFEHSKEEEVKKTKREHTLKKTVIILLAALIALVLLIGALKVVVRLKELALGMATIAGAPLPVDENGFTNVLLLGAGDNDHDGIDLIDTIMIASIDPVKTESIVMLSIPRDTYILKTEKMGRNRINSLYRDYKNELKREGKTTEEASIESLKELTKEVGTLIGIDLQGAIKVNFSGFEQAIDSIGGIDVVVPEDLVDPEYPGPNYTYETFSISAGPQHLNGATALKYARSRHSTSDFSRSARQQQIIEAAAAKVKEGNIIGNISKMTQLLSIVSKNTETTFSSRELMTLGVTGKSLDMKNIVGMQLNDQNGLYGSLVQPGGFLYAPPREEFGDASVLLPVSIPAFPVTWKQIQTLTSLLLLKREAFLDSPTIVVANGGAKEGLARKLGGELYRYGFDVIDIRNYGPKGSPTFETSFVALNPGLNGEQEQEKKKHVELNTELLSSILHLETGTTPDSAPFEEDGADILIVLGKDFQYTSVQELLSRAN